MNELLSMSNFINSCEHNCSMIQKKHFKKGEIITTYIQKRNQFCILASGQAELIRYDFNGNKTIVERFSKNDIFGEVFYVLLQIMNCLLLLNKVVTYFFLFMIIF